MADIAESNKHVKVVSLKALTVGTSDVVSGASANTTVGVILVAEGSATIEVTSSELSDIRDDTAIWVAHTSGSLAATTHVRLEQDWSGIRLNVASGTFNLEVCDANT